MSIRQRLAEWFHRIPAARPFETRQATLLQLMLLGLAGMSLVSLPVNLFTPGSLLLRLILFAAHLSVLLCAVLALSAVRHGLMGRAVGLTVAGLEIALTVVMLINGLSNSPVPIFALALPLTMAGLLAGRRALILAALGSALAVGLVILLEGLSPPLAGLLPPGSLPPAFLWITFVVILVVLSLFLEAFGMALRASLAELGATNQQLEAELVRRRQLEEQLLATRRLESLGRMAGGIAHDFNNMLTAIGAYTSMAVEQLPSDSPVREDLNGSLKATERAAGLTRQLLAFARRQRFEPRVFDLNELLNESSSLLRRLMGDTIELELRLAPAASLIRGDPGQIEQVLVNLAANARDAMPEGGRLTIELQNVTLDQDYADRRVGVIAGRYVVLTVSDTGVGMDQAVQERVFEPFFTTKEAGRGTGLGLATCYGIINQHNGAIWLYSELKRGTTFKIHLPQVDGAGDAPAQPAGEATMPRGTETVLVVEDDQAVREVMARILRELGYTVLAANDGLAALETLALTDRRIDLLLTDLAMPRMGGLDLAERLRAADNRLRVLYTTGSAEEQSAQLEHRNSRPALIGKPFTPGALARAVRQALDENP